MRLGRYLFASLCLSGLLACQPPDDAEQRLSPDASLILRPCTQEQFSHRGNRKDFQCGSLAVAENPEAVSGRQISLNIVRLPALSQSPQPDPVFVLAGGPGQASTEIVSGVTPWMRLVNRERDIIFVDQRGTGKSNPLDCGEDVEPDFSLSSEQVEQQQHALLNKCLNSYDADLRFYTTPYAADDFDAVREALGYEQINVWGASYGTRLALEIVRRHGDSVRSAVLDSVAPVGINLPESVLVDADRAMGLIVDLCEAQESCADNFPNLNQRLGNLIQHLDQTPAKLTMTHPLKGEEFSLTLDGQAIAGLLRLGLYSREISPTLPLMIDSATKNNFAPLMTLLSMSEDFSGGISVGLQHSILCVEDVARVEGQDDIANSILQLRSIEAIKKVCEFWPQGKLPADYFEPVSSDTPVLLLSGNLDPVTPPYWGDKAAETLSQHLHIVVAGAHHGASTLGCVPELIDDFFISMATEDVDIACADDIVPSPPFITAAGPAMSIIESKSANQDVR